MVNTTEIRVYMARRGNMSVTELAARIGKSPSTVGRWLESGDMPVTYAERIIEALQIPTDDAINIFFGLRVAGRATNGREKEWKDDQHAICPFPHHPRR